MERLFYNCEKIKLSYYNDEANQIYKDVNIKYSEFDNPMDSNYYLSLTGNKIREAGSLLHVYLYDKEGSKTFVDKGLFIVDKNSRLVSITCGEQFYKPLYKAYDDLIHDIEKIGKMEE